MADFKRQQDFRKGSLLRKINEDPTYLSFFLVFDTQNREESPLFAGPAMEYLTQVLNQDYAAKYSVALENFQKVLLKINKELPWFWQTISGVDVAMTYNNLADPWWGAETPKLEIECLEENVELTAIGLMDLYKRACYDFTRWVEVIPPNLRHFQMQVWVSEVRRFQQDTGAKDLGFFDNPDNSGNGGNVTKINQEFSLEAKPFIQLNFSHCEFDIDSIAPMFADLGKNPELKKPKIGIKWGSVQQINQKLGANLVTEVDDSPLTQAAQGDYNPFDPTADRRTIDDTARGGFALPGDPTFKSVLKDNTLGKIGDAVDDAISGITGRIDSAKNSLTLQNNSDIGNVHGKTTGLASTLIDRATESVLSKLLLGNVHGISGGSLLDAVQAGSINAIANQLGGLFGGDNNSGGSGGINEKIHPAGVDSSPDGFLNYRIHESGVDSTPDGNLNENVHE
jgi:hypothetical protein